MGKLTFSKGVVIVIAFSALVLSCINVVMWGESDLSGIAHNLRAISIAETGDSRLRIRIFDSVHYLQVPPAFRKACGEVGNVICALARDMAASVKQSIGNLKNHKLP
jgi:hypothetical protein